ncbi:MAG: hypothetical protein Kow0040_14770 [Thermogutta sp.]
MTILEALKESWALSPELTELVPADSVFIGPVNPGFSAPAVGFVRQQQETGLHTSTGRFVTVTVVAEVQAEDPETLEDLADRIREYLTYWSSSRFMCFEQKGVSATIERSETSPSTLWQAEITIVYDAERR